MSKYHYEERVICFLDILCFKELIEKSVTEAKVLDQIQKSIMHVQELIKNEDTLNKITGRITTQFSDSVVISYKLKKESSIYSILSDIMMVQFQFAAYDVAVRGGIAIGKLVHTDKLLFGPAMNEAYRLESTIAKNPRVILTKEIISSGLKYHGEQHSSAKEEEYIHDLVNLNNDGYYYIDYIKHADSWVPTGLEILEPLLKTGLNHTSETVRVKYQWLASKILEKSYFNNDPNDLFRSLRHLINELKELGYMFPAQLIDKWLKLADSLENPGRSAICNSQNELCKISIDLKNIVSTIDPIDYHLAGSNWIFTWKEDQNDNKKCEQLKNNIEQLIISINKTYTEIIIKII